MSFDLNKHPGHYAGELPVAASTTLETGGLVAIDASGDCVPAGTVTAAAVAGRLSGAPVDNSAGAAGAKTALIERGIFSALNSTSGALAKAHIGKAVFAESPDTVRSTKDSLGDQSVDAPVAGILLGFDVDGLPIVDTTQAALYVQAILLPAG